MSALGEAFTIDLERKSQERDERTVEVVDPQVKLPDSWVPTMRLIAVLLAQGKPSSEIALLLKLDESRVKALMQTRELANILNELPDQSTVINKVLEGSVLDSLTFLITVRDNPTHPVVVRVNATKLLLDHALGTPESKSKTGRQRNLEDGPNITDAKERGEYLLSEIKRLKIPGFAIPSES
jgi:hypothetical protein